MPQHLGLGDLGQRGGPSAAHVVGDRRRHIPDRIQNAFLHLRHQDAALALAAQLKDDGLVPSCLVEAAQVGLTAGVPLSPDVPHDTTSCSAVARRSRSLWV